MPALKLKDITQAAINGRAVYPAKNPNIQASWKLLN
jgi:hypothetical protein